MARKIQYTHGLSTDYHPHKMVKVDGVDQELISYPYPMDPEKGDNEAWICVRFKDDPTTLKHVPLSVVKLLPRPLLQGLIRYKNGKILDSAKISRHSR